MALLPEYTRGMHDLGDGCHVWLEPDGSWGLANSGVVVDSAEALVVDTQNDVRMGADLRQAVSEVLGAAHVSTVVNTHADGDHWNGNLFYEGARILSSQATYDEMTSMWLDPASLADMATDDTAFGRFVAWRIERFDLTDWRPVLPTETFEDLLAIQVGARTVDLIQVGPAHTRGDTIVEVESAGVVFAGDVLFADSTPIMWAGPLSRCIEACERIVANDPRIVVPGHGPVIEAADVRAVSGYLEYVLSHATAEHDAGRSPLEAFRSIDLGAYAQWKHLSRTYQNILAVYRELDPDQFTVSPQEALEVVLAEDDGDWISGQVCGGQHA